MKSFSQQPVTSVKVPELIAKLETLDPSDLDDWLPIYNIVLELGVLGDTRALPVLKRLTAPASMIGSYARNAIRSIRSANPVDKEMIEQVLDDLGDRSSWVHDDAFYWFAGLPGEVKASQYMPQLADLLVSKPHYIQQYVVDTLKANDEFDPDLFRDFLDVGTKERLIRKWSVEIPPARMNASWRIVMDSKGNPYSVDPAGIRKYVPNGEFVARVGDMKLLPIVRTRTDIWIEDDDGAFFAYREAGEVVVRRVDRAGRTVWTTRLGELDTPYIALLHVGEYVQVLGTFTNENIPFSPNTSLFLCRLDKDGKLRSLMKGNVGADRNFLELPAFNPSFPCIATVSSADDVIVVFKSSNWPYQRKRLICFGADGYRRWDVPVNDFGQPWDTISGIEEVETDAEGNIYVAGSDGTGRGLILSLNEDGIRLWSEHLYIGTIRSISVDDNGHLYAAWDARTADEIEIAKLEASTGDQLWSRRFALDPDHEGRGGVRSLDVDPEGELNVFVSWTKFEGRGMKRTRGERFQLTVPGE